MLGMYKVAPAGVDVEITITESREESPASDRRDAGTHTSPPAGRDQPDRAEVVQRRSAPAHHAQRRRARRRPRSPTPHAAPATTSSPSPITTTRRTRREPMPSSPLHIVGEEVTTPGGHANVWGLPEGAWIDFRVAPSDPAPPTPINGLVDAAHQRRGAVLDQPSDRQLRRLFVGRRSFPSGIDAHRDLERTRRRRATRRSRSGIACCAQAATSRRSASATGIGQPAPIDAAAVRVLGDRPDATGDSRRHSPRSA